MSDLFEKLLDKPDGNPAEAIQCLRKWLDYYEWLYRLYKLRGEINGCVCRPVGRGDGDTYVVDPRCTAHNPEAVR